MGGPALRMASSCCRVFLSSVGWRRLRDAILVRRRGLLGGLDLPLRIGRQVQKGHVLLFVGVRVDHVDAMTRVGP